jgi:hypothetical protein
VTQDREGSNLSTVCRLTVLCAAEIRIPHPRQGWQWLLGSGEIVGWITLPRNLLEQQLDALGLERNRFETGVVDPDSVANTERLTDYPDYPTDPEDALEG